MYEILILNLQAAHCDTLHKFSLIPIFFQDCFVFSVATVSMSQTTHIICVIPKIQFKKYLTE